MFEDDVADDNCDPNDPNLRLYQEKNDCEELSYDDPNIIFAFG